MRSVLLDYFGIQLKIKAERQQEGSQTFGKQSSTPECPADFTKQTNESEAKKAVEGEFRGIHHSKCLDQKMLM